MPAPFVAQLCGFREGRPNTSDKNDKQSIYLGSALFHEIGIAATTPEPLDVGRRLEELAEADLSARRPDVFVSRSSKASDFAQYRHLALTRNARVALKRTRKLEIKLETQIEKLRTSGPKQIARSLDRIGGSLGTDLNALQELVDDLPNESMLGVDLAMSDEPPPGQLRIAVSAKWSLRTDRAQDCLTQGAKLSLQRRGRMPHYAVLTMEPRPAMLALLADGSGSVDCVYHLDLPSLMRAAESVEQTKLDEGSHSWRPKATLDRMVQQLRLRDYDDLVSEVLAIPNTAVPPPPSDPEESPAH